MTNTMMNEQRKIFRRWEREQCKRIEASATLEAAFELYAIALNGVQLIALLFPDEPLELPRGNLKSCMEMFFEDYLKRMTSEELTAKDL